MSWSTPGVLARLVDGAGQAVEPGAPGELLLKGANLFSGYWRRPEDTQAAFTPDGWFRTGDIAVRDEDGFFAIVDRKKDMFISGGENVYPAEVENVLYALPGVREAALVGVPDPVMGHALKAIVVTDRDDLDARAIMAHCRAHLAQYKIPRIVEFTSALPRTASGKIKRIQLMEQPAEP